MSDKRMVEPSPEFDDWAALSRKFGHLSIAECYAGLEERDQLRADLAEARTELERLKDSLKYFGELNGKEAEHQFKTIDALRERNARLVEGLTQLRLAFPLELIEMPGQQKLCIHLLKRIDKLLASGSGEGQ